MICSYYFMPDITSHQTILILYYWSDVKDKNSIMKEMRELKIEGKGMILILYKLMMKDY